MGSKIQSRVKEFSPGPAVYNPTVDLVTKHSPQYKLDKAPRTGEKIHSLSPGPGAYNPRAEIFTRQGGQIGHSGRSRLMSPDTPGPGTYHIPVKFAWTPKYLLPSKPEDVKYI